MPQRAASTRCVRIRISPTLPWTACSAPVSFPLHHDVPSEAKHTRAAYVSHDMILVWLVSSQQRARGCGQANTWQPVNPLVLTSYLESASRYLKPRSLVALSNNVKLLKRKNMPADMHTPQQS